MTTVRAIRTFNSKGQTIPAGTMIRIPDEALPALAGLVEVVTTTAWLQNGELRVSGYVPDLAGVIVSLTGDNLELQRRLLEEHCQRYGDTHLPALVEDWQERAAIMEHDGGLSRADAEEQAAKQYHLLGWLGELRGQTIH